MVISPICAPVTVIVADSASKPFAVKSSVPMDPMSMMSWLRRIIMRSLPLPECAEYPTNGSAPSATLFHPNAPSAPAKVSVCPSDRKVGPTELANVPFTVFVLGANQVIDTTGHLTRFGFADGH